MGTLGCINDMLQRDKENRELRKRNRERLTATYHRLLDTGKETDLSQITVEKMEDIRRKTLEKVNPEKPDVPLNKNDAFQKVQKRRVQEKR